MKIVIAIDSFKGCISSLEANEAVACGIKRVLPDAHIVSLPVSDGGEGMTETWKSLGVSGVQEVLVNVHGPLMEPLTVQYLIDTESHTAIMEMASAAGLPLVPHDKRNPELTTTYGFGEMLSDAINRGCTHIIAGIGGSATCDAGEGMLAALRANGLSSDKIKGSVRITVACDVQNPLFGSEGASYVFSPQKGADAAMVERLDRRLRQIYEESGCTDSQPGDGAAGGLGFALRYHLGAILKPGIDVMLDALHFDGQICNADLVITGEGSSDRQTLMGKVPYGILRRAQKKDIPVLLIAGKIADADALLTAGFHELLCINAHDSRPLDILMQPSVAKQNIENEIQGYCTRSRRHFDKQ